MVEVVDVFRPEDELGSDSQGEDENLSQAFEAEDEALLAIVFARVPGQADRAAATKMES